MGNDARERGSDISAALLVSRGMDTEGISLSGHLSGGAAKRPRLSPPPEELRRRLLSAAEALATERAVDFSSLAESLKPLVSVSGNPSQRLGAYLLEALIARHVSSGAAIYRSLCGGAATELLYDVCPYFKFAYMAANGAIAEAVKDHDVIHIVDFSIGSGAQWATLIQALSARPGGPPSLRITGVGASAAAHHRLKAVAHRCCIPLEFSAVSLPPAEVTPEMLHLRSGEALAVSLHFLLHRTPDESVDLSNPRDGLLRMVKGLSPRVVTLVEQESNTNTAPFLTRFWEVAEYYDAVFESVEAALPRRNGERAAVERGCLAAGIVNVVACEGEERVERGEVLGKWRSRFMMAGFSQRPLSGHVNSVIRALLGSYSAEYRAREKDGALLLGWKERDLVSASAWC